MLFSQERTLTGTVVDNEDAPLPTVNVIIKGTTTGTITDIDGNFSVMVPDNNTVLVVTSIGYVNQEIEVGNQTHLDIQMEEDLTQLSEVVVTGYGSRKKETLTGSVANISGSELKKNPMPNLTSSLAGKLPGLTINQRSGEPGRDDPSILVRGTGTFVSDPSKLGEANQPLIIIDGVPRSMMSRLNPNDIESVSVLKDASAAIYGARAANGVIIITTKSGTEGKPVFDFSYNYAIQQPSKIPDMLDAATFAEAFNEGDWYRKGRPTGDTYVPFYSDDAIQAFRDGSDPVLYPNTDWMGQVLKPYSMVKRMNLQVNGGTEDVKYLFSFGSLYQDGNYEHNPTEYQQFNLRSKIDVDITKNLSVGMNVYAILNNRTYSVVGTWVNFYNILHSNPTLPATYPNGLIAPGRLGENPLLLDQRGTDKIDDMPIYSTFTASYKVPFISGLRIDGSFNYDINNQFEKRFSLPYYYYEYDVNTEEYMKTQGTGASTVELWDTYRKWTTMMYNIRIVYDRTFEKHHVGLMIGQEQQKNTFQYAEAYRKNFVSSAIDQINAGSTDPEDKNNSGSSSATAYNNFFGRFNYDYSSKYLVEFLFRYDGSQIFPEGKRYGFFPGISAGWRLSEEAFIQDNFSFIDQLKLRASWGQVGNDRVDPYQYLQSFSFGDNYVFGVSDVPGIYANTLPNPNITWEVSEKTDVALEAALWKNLLSLEIIFFREYRTNILAERNLSIPSIYGFSDLPSENFGEVKNLGYEVILRHRNSLGKLIYNVEANLAFARNEIVFMDETPQVEIYQNQTGHPIGTSLYYQADGIFNTQEELDEYPHPSGSKLGDVKIVDLNGDSVINARDQFRFDYTATPEFVFGLTFNFLYRNFDLNVFLQGQTNAYNYDGAFTKLGNTAFDNAVVARAEDRWTVDNPDGTMPRSDFFEPGASTFFLYDATFVRLKTLELGYSLPDNLVTRLKLKGMRFYANGINLITWAKEIKWSDPELSGEFVFYPQQRIINMGLNIKF
ncbi:MAG: TonB-dependent receptor [Bacteroidales bacterium]|nr:TonB-dependent receptor [Bacteroidales bacterium]